MTTKGRLARLEKKAAANEQAGAAFYIFATQTPDDPNVFNLKGYGIETRNIHEKNIHAEAVKIAETQPGYNKFSFIHTILITKLEPPETA